MAVKLARSGSMSATHVRIDKFSEFQMDGTSSSTFTSCEVENDGYRSMRQNCIFDPDGPDKMQCVESAQPIVFGGQGTPVTVENQVHMRIDLDSTTGPCSPGLILL